MVSGLTSDGASRLVRVVSEAPRTTGEDRAHAPPQPVPEKTEARGAGQTRHLTTPTAARLRLVTYVG